VKAVITGLLQLAVLLPALCGVVNFLLFEATGATCFVELELKLNVLCDAGQT
jgi:hypothetical protein